MPIHIKRPPINKRLLILSLTHFLNDLHAAFLPAFMPLIVSRLGISYAQAGILRSLSGVLHIIVQPMAGYFSDIFSRPYAIIVGPIMSALGAGLLPSAPSYGMALLIVGLWGFGSAVYHPLGYGSVGYVGDPVNLGLFIAIFSIGGILGATLSPLYAIFLMESFGAGLLLPLAALVPVLAGALLVIRFIPTLKAEGPSGSPSPMGFLRSFRSTFKSIFPLWLLCLCRDTSFEGVRFFLPLLIASRGGSIVQIGTVLFWISAIGTISPVIGGRLADRFGARRIIMASMTLAPFFLVPAALMRGFPSILFYMTGNALLEAILPVTNAAAQGIAPQARSTAASIVTGLSFGLAGLLLAPIGAMADIFGLTPVLVFTGMLPFFPLPVFWTMWKQEKRQS